MLVAVVGDIVIDVDPLSTSPGAHPSSSTAAAR